MVQKEVRATRIGMRYRLNIADGIVSILSSTLTPGIHPTFPLRFVSFGNIFPVPETSAPNADIVVDLISSFVGVHKPGMCL